MTETDVYQVSGSNQTLRRLGTGGTSWTAVRDASDANGGSTLTGSARAWYYAATNSYRMSRGPFVFDSSALSGVVSAASIFVYISKETITDSANAGLVFVGDSGSNVYPAVAYASGDYAKSKYDFVTPLCTFVPDESLTQGAYHEFALNADGLNQVSLGGFSRFLLIEGHDYENDAPTGDNNYEWDRPTEANPAYIKITHAPAPPPEIVEADLYISQEITSDVNISQEVTSDLYLTQEITEDVII